MYTWLAMSKTSILLILYFVLEQSYWHMERYKEAREVLENALMVGNKESINLGETREGAGVAKELGWISG